MISQNEDLRKKKMISHNDDEVNQCCGSGIINRGIFLGFFLLCMLGYCIQHCFICRPSDSNVSEYAGIEPRTVATLALAVRSSNNSARSYLLDTQIDLISISPDLSNALRVWGSGSYCKTKPKTQVFLYPSLTR